MQQSKTSIPDQVVVSKIHLLRGQNIMLDKDIAELYGVKAKRLREQVRRNRERFPKNFMFQLSAEEADFMVTQNASPSKQHFGGSLPYAFTEHGVLMLASVLRSGLAVQMSIKIIEVFVKMREMFTTQTELLVKLNDIEGHIADHDGHIQVLYEHLKKLLTEKKIREANETRKRIGFSK